VRSVLAFGVLWCAVIVDCRFLIKWSALGYDEATWDTRDALGSACARDGVRAVTCECVLQHPSKQRR
jgi:hypothetical protein